MTDLLVGRRVLVVEDDFFIADTLAKALRTAGAEVIGPVGSIDDALDLLEDTDQLDGALLDLNLHGEMAYPVADALRERAIPFTFATGYDEGAIPSRYSDVPFCEKPVGADVLVRALFRQ